jgi:hypothetical protein
MGTKGSKKKGKKLEVNKVTLKDLTPSAPGSKGVRGGGGKGTMEVCSNPCPVTFALCRPRRTAGCVPLVLK